MIDFDKLERDILTAQKAADAVTDLEDGGTCNFDSVCVYLGRNTKALREGLSRLEFRVCKVDAGAYWSGWYFVGLKLKGQAALRTRMAEAGEKSLKESGWSTRVYYEVD